MHAYSTCMRTVCLCSYVEFFFSPRVAAMPGHMDQSRSCIVEPRACADAGELLDLERDLESRLPLSREDRPEMRTRAAQLLGHFPNSELSRCPKRLQLLPRRLMRLILRLTHAPIYTKVDSKVHTKMEAQSARIVAWEENSEWTSQRARLSAWLGWLLRSGQRGCRSVSSPS